MSGAAEIRLEVDRTRITSTLDVTPDRGTDPTISVDPQDQSVTVASRDASTGGRIEIRDASGSVVTAELDASADSGRFTLNNGSGAAGVSLNAASPTPMVGVPDPQSPGVAIEPGRLTIHQATTPDPPVLEAQDSGTLAVRNADDITTGVLDGEAGTLELYGSPEPDPTVDIGSPRPEFGGGDLVVAAHGTPDDIHFHATAEEGSDYGVDDDNRPRILLNGPTATLEVGRHGPGQNRLPVPGTIRFRDDQHGESVLELHAEQTITQNFSTRQFGEVEFRYFDAPKLRYRGAVRPHSDGLMVYDAGGNPALLLSVTGDLRTRKPVSTDPNL